MSEDEEEPERDHYGFYGKALEPYDEETIPKRRPISVEDQIATDAQGRRRFHGAFTGGFSAGFFNTVGSLEGWRPSEFKSSRGEKAENRSQKPEDYMDDEDIGEFGIAPQKIKATKDFNTSKKRKKQVFADGPIPGEPVLHTLIESGNDTIGYLLLRNMGYKHCTEDEEEMTEDETPASAPAEKIYGCQMPKTVRTKKTLRSSLPEEYQTMLKAPKKDTFGMGYSGLDRSHINLFTSAKLVVNERDNKKLSITGQAFGVGAFEDDDEDIYVKEDLSRYDFELTGSEKNKTRSAIPLKGKLVLEMFVKSKAEYRMTETFPPPTIPASFTGKHRVKKSRFAPVEVEPPKVIQRQDMDATSRAKLLGETPNPNPRKIDVKSHTESVQAKKGIAQDPKRVTKFDVGPASGSLFDKFVSAGNSDEHTELLQPVDRMETQHGTKEMREAVKMKMFGPLTRTSETWIPNSLVCKRFNVPEPMICDSNEMKASTRRHRNLIFENAHVLDDGVPDMASSGGLMNVASKCAETVSSVLPAAVEQQTIDTRGSESVPTPAAPTSAPDVQKKALDPTDKLDISKNVDLFRAVFIDSDSDGEDNEAAIAMRAEEARQREQQMKTQILAEDLLVPQIRPIRHGILSNVECTIMPDEMTPPQNKETATATMKNANDEKEDVNAALYGPSLPTKITYRKPVHLTNNQVIDKAKSSSDSDDWIEKDKSNGEEQEEEDEERRDPGDKEHKQHRKTDKIKEKKRHRKKHKKERHKSKTRHKHKKTK